MGVQISDIVKGREVELTELSGKKIAIDGYNTLYQFGLLICYLKIILTQYNTILTSVLIIPKKSLRILIYINLNQ